MDIKEKAKQFAIKAHKGQVRKSEPDKPMIIHPISVGMLLEKYGCDDNVVAAGYLHDVVEDTEYTLEDIRSEFGDDIASLVSGASEPDKSLSWEERKKHTIETTRNLPLRNKLVVCADKINNLEDMALKFHKEKQRDFSKFKRGEEQQKWYYTSVYESLVSGYNEDIPLFKRLKRCLDILFPSRELSISPDVLSLYAQRAEIERLKLLCSMPSPVVIEVAGTPRVNKTDAMNSLYKFFDNGTLKVTEINSLTTSKYFDETIKPQINGFSQVDRIVAKIEDVYRQLSDALDNGSDIILIDKTIGDRDIWNHILHIQGVIGDEEYQNNCRLLTSLSTKLYDCLLITYADALDYLGMENTTNALERGIAIAQDDFYHREDILDGLKQLFEESERALAFDSSETTPLESSNQIALAVMPDIRKKYINTFKKECDL